MKIKTWLSHLSQTLISCSNEITKSEWKSCTDLNQHLVIVNQPLKKRILRNKHVYLNLHLPFSVESDVARRLTHYSNKRIQVILSYDGSIAEQTWKSQYNITIRSARFSDLIALTRLFSNIIDGHLCHCNLIKSHQ